jgi:hypothetical protein
MVVLGHEDKLEARSVCLEIVLILTQDRCIVCAKRTIGSEIILDTPDGTPRLQGPTGSSFQYVWICANLDAR